MSSATTDQVFTVGRFILVPRSNFGGICASRQSTHIGRSGRCRMQRGWRSPPGPSPTTRKAADTLVALIFLRPPQPPMRVPLRLPLARMHPHAAARRRTGLPAGVAAAQRDGRCHRVLSDVSGLVRVQVPPRTQFPQVTGLRWNFLPLWLGTASRRVAPSGTVCAGQRLARTRLGRCGPPLWFRPIPGQP
jgi:hypothetical protein